MIDLAYDGDDDCGDGGDYDDEGREGGKVGRTKRTPYLGSGGQEPDT